MQIIREITLLMSDTACSLISRPRIDGGKIKEFVDANLEEDYKLLMHIHVSVYAWACVHPLLQEPSAL